MKNLKRALSLALATVMTMGMMMVGTGAASAPDVNDEHNVEAIEVLKAVGIMEGVDEEGNFAPDTVLNRYQMAVVMCRLMQVDPDKFDGPSHFEDIPAGHWATKYVNACYENNIISGISETEFGGDLDVKVVDGTLMVMKTLGYFEYKEEFENDYALATIKNANKIKLLQGMSSIKADAKLTRNDVAQLLLNGLEADTVFFDGSLGTNIALPDGTVVNAGFVSDYGWYGYSGIDYDGSIDPDTNEQLVEKLFGDTVRKTAIPDGDGMERRGHKWTVNKQDVLFVADSADYEEIVANSGKTVATFVTDVMKKNFDFSTASATVHVNGGNNVGTTYTLKVGSTVEFYMSENATHASNVVAKVVITEPKVYTLSADPATREKDGKIEVIVPGVAGLSGYDADNNVESVFGWEDLTKGDVVLVYTTDGATPGTANAKTYITKADSVSGVIEAKHSTKGLLMNDTYYTNSGLTNTSNNWKNEDFENEYTLYLDAAGKVVKAVKNTNVSSNDYALVLETKWINGTTLRDGSYAEARLLFPDGTIEVVTVAEINDYAVNGTNTDTTADADGLGYNYVDNLFVTYVVNDEGKYELTCDTSATKTFGTTSLDGDKANFEGSFVANENTVFLVNTVTDATSASKAKITVYNGITAMGDVSTLVNTGGTTADDGKTHSVVLENSNGYASIVYVVAASSNITGSSDEYIYFPGIVTTPATATTEAVYGLAYKTVPFSATKNYYEYEAIVDGEPTTVLMASTTSNMDNTGDTTADGNIAVRALYKVVSRDSNGAITLVSSNGISATGTGVKVEDNVMYVGTTATTTYKFNDDTEVYYIDVNGAVTQINAADIKKDSTDIVYVAKTSNNGAFADVVYIVEKIKTTLQIDKIDYVLDDGTTGNITATITSDYTAAGLGNAGKTLEITGVTCSDNATYTVSGTAVIDGSGTAGQITITVVAENGLNTVDIVLTLQSA